MYMATIAITDTRQLTTTVCASAAVLLRFPGATATSPRIDWAIDTVNPRFENSGFGMTLVSGTHPFASGVNSAECVCHTSHKSCEHGLGGPTGP